MPVVGARRIGTSFAPGMETEVWANAIALASCNAPVRSWLPELTQRFTIGPYIWPNAADCHGRIDARASGSEGISTVGSGSP